MSIRSLNERGWLLYQK